MAFTGNEDHSITLAEAADLTKNYRDSLSSSSDTIAHYFSEKAILEILAQEDCIGIRVYYGLNSLGEKKLVLVGVNPSENDLYEGKLADKSKGCPSHCSTANPLNSDSR